MVRKIALLLCVVMSTLMLSSLCSVSLANAEQANEQPNEQQNNDYKLSQKKEDIVARIEEYIKDELTDAAYYEELKKMAPTESERVLIEEIIKDERLHADRLSLVVSKLTGKEYTFPAIEPPVIPSNYQEALRQRFKGETNGFERYATEYINAKNDDLKKLFYQLGIEENIHAERLLLLLDLLADRT